MKNLDKWILCGLMSALVFVLLGTFVFYESNETLDMVAERLGVIGENLLTAPFPEYTFPWFDSVWVSLMLGMISTIIIFTITYGIGKLLAKVREKSETN
ncbi:MAG: hypothetical protein N3D12_04795 [Candidatus Methanomethyliaceae archaeon]|nr:hypothetical protein [Candidatus Methanomethyliaceae archaeon]